MCLVRNTKMQGNEAMQFMDIVLNEEEKKLELRNINPTQVSKKTEDNGLTDESIEVQNNNIIKPNRVEDISHMTKDP